ncbi:MAG: C10 family peptidase [Bacteroidales bacterium]|nr:C10 family peptidase [Bacteroidales bacterium]
MKKLYFTLLLVICGLFFGTLSAQQATQEQVSLACSHFLADRFYPQTAPSFKFEEALTNENGDVCLYRFSLDGTGFVIVSASQSVMPVLAYSFDDNFEMIPPVKDILHLYGQVVRATEEGNAPADPKGVADWKRYLSDDFTPSSPKTPTQGPLLTTRWNQNKFYNTYCPWDAAAGSYYDYRVPNGCVALACAQIMNYHRFPDQGTGGSTYVPQGYPRQTVNYTQHHYYWNAMCNRPDSYACEIAKLAWHFGVAIKMGYTPDGSGAQTDDAMHELATRFHYDANIKKYEQDLFTADSASRVFYVNMLKGEIDARRPVYYAGCSESSCHAYVLDGYDSDDRFHLNYGWGGASNAFYALQSFTAGNTHYDYSGSAIVKIYPSGTIPDTYCQGHQRNTASFGYVADGSPTTKPYQPNPDCSWMVAVPNASSYTFSFDRLDLNPNVDYVTIYNGPTVQSGVKVALTGNNVPSGTYTVNADSVLITFTTTGSVASNTDYYGFLISYTSELATPTCGAYNITDWHTELSDGSADGVAYRAESNCSWNISLNYIAGYAFNFTKFDLGYGDFVDIYDATTNPPTLHQRFDIYNPPTGIYNVPFRKMRVNFVADNYDQRDGFVFSYYAIAGVEEYSGLEDLTVYPNPASDAIHVRFSLDEVSAVNCRLTDLSGKTLRTESIPAESGENSYTIDVSSLSSGFYMLEMSTSKGKAVRKVMVQ